MVVVGEDDGDDDDGDGDGDGARPVRGPQSVQSVPQAHMLNSAPDPPSSQSPSDAKAHVS